MDGFLDLALAAVVPVVLMAAQRRPDTELNALFAQLRASDGVASAHVLIERIWACWMAHDRKVPIAHSDNEMQSEPSGRVILLGRGILFLD